MSAQDGGCLFCLLAGETSGAALRCSGILGRPQTFLRIWGGSRRRRRAGRGELAGAFVTAAPRGGPCEAASHGRGGAGLASSARGTRRRTRPESARARLPGGGRLVIGVRRYPPRVTSDAGQPARPSGTRPPGWRRTRVKAASAASGVWWSRRRLR